MKPTITGSKKPGSKPGSKPAENPLGTDKNDNFIGSKKRDVINGGAGDDKLFGMVGNDFLTGGLGLDKLFGSIGNDLLIGSEGGDQLNGGSGKDKLFGNSENDVLAGGNSKDILYGGTGSDTLYGGNGNDILIGADAIAAAIDSTTGLSIPVTEVDSLTGGRGKDTFVLGIAANGTNSATTLYNAGGNADYALIKDFKNPDLIQLAGTATEYSLGASPVGTPVGVALYHNTIGKTPELIAILAGVDPTSVNLASGHFTFVQ
jgi:Ca2+-binding RTX toxin-like protein